MDISESTTPASNPIHGQGISSCHRGENLAVAVFTEGIIQVNASGSTQLWRWALAGGEIGTDLHLWTWTPNMYRLHHGKVWYMHLCNPRFCGFPRGEAEGEKHKQVGY